MGINIDEMGSTFFYLFFLIYLYIIFHFTQRKDFVRDNKKIIKF